LDADRPISVCLVPGGFLYIFASVLCAPLLPAFSTEFAIGTPQSLLALSLATGFLAVSILCAGALWERIGRRGLMFASMMLAALFNLIAALAASWHGILAACALEGFALGGVPAVAMAYLAEELILQD
jgi:YNFM family putative membrane transporter